MNAYESFRFLCRCLSLGRQESAAINQLRQQIADDAVDWEQVVHMASVHLVTPSLYWELAQKDLLPDLPTDLRDYLETLFELNGDRNNALRRQALELVRLLNSLGVEPVLLKGIAGLLTDLYDAPGIRVIGDLDILVPEKSLPTTIATLQVAGYFFSPEQALRSRWHHHSRSFA